MQPHDRLRAAVEERLELAKAAKSHTGRWSWGHGFGEMCNDKECPFGVLLDEAESDGKYAGTVLMEVHGYDIHRPWGGAAHIAANDPAFVIRSCERDLRVLERHQPVHMNPPVACSWCKAPSDAFSDVPWPCAEIRDLAAVYAVDLTEGGQSSGG